MSRERCDLPSIYRSTLQRIMSISEVATQPVRLSSPTLFSRRQDKPSHSAEKASSVRSPPSSGYKRFFVVCDVSGHLNAVAMPPAGWDVEALRERRTRQAEGGRIRYCLAIRIPRIAIRAKNFCAHWDFTGKFDLRIDHYLGNRLLTTALTSALANSFLSRSGIGRRKRSDHHGGESVSRLHGDIRHDLETNDSE